MVTYLLPTILFSFFSMILLVIYYLKSNITKENVKNFFGLIFILAGISFIIVITIFPFPINIDEIYFMIDNHLGASHSWIPFQAIYENVIEISNGRFEVFCYQVIGNILLFIPLGIGLTLYFSDVQKCFKKTISIVLLVTISIESMQFVFGVLLGYVYRSTDIDDIILNTLGGLIGYWIIFKMNNSNKTQD